MFFFFFFFRGFVLDCPCALFLGWCHKYYIYIMNPMFLLGDVLSIFVPVHPKRAQFGRFFNGNVMDEQLIGPYGDASDFQGQLVWIDPKSFGSMVHLSNWFLGYCFCQQYERKTMGTQLFGAPQKRRTQ